MISENLQTLADVKQNLKTAIEGKGRDLTNIPFTQYPQEIEAIQTGGAGENKLAKLVSGENVELIASDLEGATKIMDSAFYKSNLKSIIIPSSVTSIDNAGFYNCKYLTEITVPSNVKTIGNSAFYNCTALTSVIIENGLTSTGYQIFQGCSKLSNVKLPDTLIKLGNSVFNSCTSLKEIEIPSEITTVGTYVFGSCSNLEKVVFKKQAPNITQGFFNSCKKLKLLDLRNCVTMPTLADTSSFGHEAGCVVVVPDSIYDTAITMNVWKDITDIVWVKASEYVES